MERRQRRVFPQAFKREAVGRVASSGLSPGRVAAELGLHETVLRRWLMQFGTQATGPARRPNTQAPAPSPSDLAAENARLRRENERLQMERDILKKPRSGTVKATKSRRFLGRIWGLPAGKVPQNQWQHRRGKAV